MKSMVFEHFMGTEKHFPSGKMQYSQKEHVKFPVRLTL